MLYIDPDECIDCGACIPQCPVEAIFYEDDVPAKWMNYIALNAAKSKVSPPAANL
jgi:ferredoxin